MVWSGTDGLDLIGSTLVTGMAREGLNLMNERSLEIFSASLLTNYFLFFGLIWNACGVHIFFLKLFNRRRRRRDNNGLHNYIAGGAQRRPASL